MSYTVNNMNDFFDAQQDLRSKYPEGLAYIEDNLGPVPEPSTENSVEEMQEMIDAIHDICLVVGG